MRTTITPPEPQWTFSATSREPEGPITIASGTPPRQRQAPRRGPAAGARGRGGPPAGPRRPGPAGDPEPLDLRRALVELHDLRVAHQLLDRVVLDEPVAAIDLHGVGRDLHRGVGGEALGVRGLQRVAAALVEQHGAVPRGQP